MLILFDYSCIVAVTAVGIITLARRRWSRRGQWLPSTDTLRTSGGHTRITCTLLTSYTSVFTTTKRRETRSLDLYDHIRVHRPDVVHFHLKSFAIQPRWTFWTIPSLHRTTTETYSWNPILKDSGGTDNSRCVTTTPCAGYCQCSLAYDQHANH